MLFRPRNTDFEFFKENRLIFDILPPEKPDVCPLPPEGEKKEPPPEAEKEREEIKKGSVDELEALREAQNNLGEAKDYIETFKTSAKFAVLAAHLEKGMEYNDTQGFANFENWLNADSKGLADIFTNPDCSFFIPSGKGKDAFVEGLRLDPPKEGDTTSEAAKKYFASRSALTEIVGHLRAYFKQKKETSVDLQKQTAKSPVGDTIGDGIKSLTKNFNRASGTEKMLILGAIGIGIALIFKYKDSKVWGETSWSKIFMGLGALWGVNYLSGKVSKDGRTIVQRMDFFRGVDELKDDNVLRGWAERNGFGEDEEKMRSFIAMQRLDVKTLFRLYESASRPGGSGEIDPKSLGFNKKEVDAKAAFEIMEALVQQTSVNEHILRLKEEAQLKGEKFVMPTKGHIEAWKTSGEANQTFREKYISGPLGATSQTLFDAIMNEYATTRTEEAIRLAEPGKYSTDAGIAAQDIKMGKEQRLPDIALDKAKKGADWAYEHTKNYTIAAGKAIYKGADKVYEVSRDGFFKPFWAGTVALFHKAVPYVETPIMSSLAHKQQEDLAKVLPPEFDVHVTAAETNWMKPEAEDLGYATIMGLPGIRFEVKWTPVGEDVAVIDGKEFNLSRGVDGNKERGLELGNTIKTKVSDLLKARNIPALAGISPAWDSAEKTWVLKGIRLNADPDIAFATGGQKDINFEIGPDGKTIKFFLAGKEIQDFDKLSEGYRDSEIETAIWKYEGLKELKVTVDKVEKDPSNRTIITGDVGGLKFQAVPNATGSGLDFFDGTKTGGAELLKIEESNNGAEFLRNKAALILASGEFQTPFFRLEHLIDNVDEGTLSSIKLLLWDRQFSAAINGKVLHRQWKHMLDYKRLETLERFKWALEGKTAADIPKVYKNYVGENLNYLENLAADIEAQANDEQVADNFTSYMQRLETMNYSNPDYVKLFNEFKEMITDGRYNYEGLESLGDLGTEKGGPAEKAFEIYKLLLYVWHYWTYEYSIEDPSAASPTRNLSDATKNDIRAKVTEKIRQHLDTAKDKGNGVIQMKNLPGHETNADLKAWVDPSLLQKKRGIKSDTL